MPELSRTQLAVYAAVAVALLLVGARAIRAEGGETAPPSAAAAPGEAEISLEGGGGEVVVDVAGAVQRPGVYRLPAGARVIDAISRAGGVDSGAAVEGINRAARLTDGQQVVVPERGSGGAVATAADSAAEGPIGLGSATVEQLEEIEGIGPVTAAAIVEYRDEQGGIASVEQLDEVSGIGPATLDSLRDRVQP